MTLIISNTEIQKAKDNSDIIREISDQVIKDFALFGMDIDFPDDIKWAYEELFNQLTVHVARMLGENDRLLLSLLYQIDVSEAKIHSEAQNKTESDLPDIITELILDREFRKVLTRHYFKNLDK